MADQEPIVIIDDQGNEHEFPAGFDPKKAAGIVRESRRQENMAAQHETGDYTTGVLNSLGETVSKTAHGIKEGVKSALNPMNTIRMIPEGVRALTDPVSIMKEGYDAAPAVLEQAKKIVTGDPEAGGEAIGQLGTMLAAPRIAPKVAPAISGAVEAVQDNPVASAAARGTGRFMVKAAKHASFPVRIAGAHQVLSGNVAPGMAMVFAPELMEGAGNSLIRLGTAPGAALTTPTGQILRMKMDLERAQAGDVDALKATKDRIAKTQSDLADQLSTARNDAEVNAVKSMQTALSQLSMRASRIEQGLTTAELNKARLEKVRNKTAGMKEGPTSVTISTPAKNELGETETARTRYSNEPAEGMTPDPADDLVKSGFARDRAQAKEILKGRAPMKAAPMQPVASHTSSLVQEPGAIADEVKRLFGDVGSRGPIRPMPSHTSTVEDFKAALEEQPGLSRSSAPVDNLSSYASANKVRNQLEAMPESVPSHPGHAEWAARHDAADKAVTSFERPTGRPMPSHGIQWTPETWREFVEKDLPPNSDLHVAAAEDALDKPMSIDARTQANQTIDAMEKAIDEGKPVSSHGRSPQQPVSGVKASASSREMSATPGLSVNDVRSIGLNPSLKITKLTREMASKILKDRALRATDYREMAALKKRLEQLIANSNQ